MKPLTTSLPVWAWPVLIAIALLAALTLGDLLGTELGSLPDWIEAVGTVGTLTVAVGVLYVEQRNRFTDEKERQARQVGGFITWAPDGSPTLIMTVTNSSPLAVRDVRGYAIRVENPDGEPWEFPDMPVLPGGDEQQVRLKLSHVGEWNLEFEFDDDAGVRWRKYGDQPLREVGRRSSTSGAWKPVNN